MSLLDTIEFREVMWLWLSVLAPLVFYLAYRSQGHVVYSSLSLLPLRGRSIRQKLAWFPAFIFALSTLAFAVAAAGPRIGDSSTEIRSEGIAIMMVMDVSSSMRALDLSPNDAEVTRLEVVKGVFQDFVVGNQALELGGRKNDAVGVIRFARYADTLSPMTLDHDSVISVADDLEIVDVESEDGTAVGDGLALAVQRISEFSPNLDTEKVIILLTDGEHNAGTETPMGAAALAKAVGVKVYTIGAGTNGMAPVRATDPFGRERLVRIPVQIDEVTLKAIAEDTGGRYFRATDFDRLQEVYAEIDALERTELSQILYREYTEYYRHALAVALLLVLLAILADSTYFRRFA